MARPKGTKYIESPDKLWELFLDYSKETKSEPRIKVEYVGKDGERVETPLERPLTLEGFKNYCRRNVGCVHDYFANTNDAYSDYSIICRAVKDEIRQDQIEGGMVGQYNPSITQRLNNLTEKQEVNVTTTPPIFPDID